MPAGITRLFKSNLDWNLYTDQQKTLDERKVGLELIDDRCQIARLCMMSSRS